MPQTNEFEGVPSAILCEIMELVRVAMVKHPHFGTGPRQGLAAIEDEVKELRFAVDWEDAARQRAEAGDVVVTALRFFAGHHVRK